MLSNKYTLIYVGAQCVLVMRGVSEIDPRWCAIAASSSLPYLSVASIMLIKYFYVSINRRIQLKLLQDKRESDAIQA